MSPSRLVRNLTFCLAVLAPLHSAHAIYLSSLHPDGATLAGRIPQPGTDDPYTAVGAIQTTVDAGIKHCTGTFINTAVIRTATQTAPDPWVLTAGHCVTDADGEDGPVADDASALIRPRGRYVNSDGLPAVRDVAANMIPGIGSDRVRRHPEYAFPQFDVGLFHVNPTSGAQRDAIAAAGRLGIRREPAGANKPALNEDVISVGVGVANVIPGTVAPRWEGDGSGGTGRGDKRWFAAKVTTAGSGTSTLFTYNQPGNGTNGNPTRHNCASDSGGPALFAGVIGGVHTSVNNATCSGTTTRNNDTNITVPDIYNWIDSYTQKAIFWDNLRIVQPLALNSHGWREDTVLDDFATDTDKDGIADNWTKTNIPAEIMNHPSIPSVTSTGWTYIPGTGPEQISDGDARSQAEWLSAANGLSVIKRTFNFDAAVSLRIDQSWNSLGISTDFGVQIGDGLITWAGVKTSQENNLDTFHQFDLAVGAGAVTVYLLNAPEPSALGLFGLVCFVLRLPRRSRK